MRFQETCALCTALKSFAALEDFTESFTKHTRNVVNEAILHACQPPGIPILAPGERITAAILDYIEYAKAKGCSMTGPEDPDILRLNVLA